MLLLYSTRDERNLIPQNGIYLAENPIEARSESSHGAADVQVCFSNSFHIIQF